MSFPSEVWEENQAEPHDSHISSSIHKKIDMTAKTSVVRPLRIGIDVGYCLFSTVGPLY